MITKQDFMWVWKDSSKESILNQFYCEHIVLRKEYEKQNKLKKWLEDKISRSWNEDAYKEMLDKILELEDEDEKR